MTSNKSYLVHTNNAAVVQPLVRDLFCIQCCMEMGQFLDRNQGILQSARALEGLSEPLRVQAVLLLFDWLLRPACGYMTTLRLKLPCVLALLHVALWTPNQSLVQGCITMTSLHTHLKHKPNFKAESNCQ